MDREKSNNPVATAELPRTRNNATIELLKRWMEEARNATSEENEAAEREVAELQAALYRNRYFCDPPE